MSTFAQYTQSSSVHKLTFTTTSLLNSPLFLWILRSNKLTLSHLKIKNLHHLEPASDHTTTTTSTAVTANANANAMPAVDPRPSDADIEDKPWKYIGYPGYSEFLASDDDLLFFRRFGVLNARVALGMQDEIAHLEAQLRAVDKDFSSVYGMDINNGSLRDEMPGRAALLAAIAVKLPKYSK